MGLAWADPDVGCGLGTMLWEGRSGMLPKLAAATTNGSSSNQSSGITSGTLGCAQDGIITAAHRLPMFAGANLDQLAAEMAAGQGESLDILAGMYAGDAQGRAAFRHLLQLNYAVLFDRPEVTAEQLLRRLDQLLERADLRAVALAS